MSDSANRSEAYWLSVVGVENNLNIANMDWEELAGAADDDGVSRGFVG
jgi:hypothetical protein